MKTTTMAQRGVREVVLFTMACLLALSGLFAVSVPRAHAAPLTEPQIQAILNLLTSFNVPAATVANVNVILHKSK